MLKIALCDSDLAALESLETLLRLELRDQDFSVFCFSGSTDILSFLENSSGLINTVMVSLSLDDACGLQTVLSVAERWPEIRIIGLDRDSDQIEAFFTCRPVFFLYKPVNRDSLRKCLAILNESSRRQRARYLSVLGRQGVTSLLCDDIHYIESDRRTLIIHEQSGSHVIYKKLDELESQVGRPFLRCHKSFLVNMDHIRYLLQDSVRLKSGIEIPVSQNRYASARNEFICYLTECKN